MAAADDTSPVPRDAAGAGRRSTAWRQWRRSRPFWGGLLLILAGAELLFIPLENVFMRGAIGIVMHMGVGGISGFLIGAVLLACGLLLWFDAEHKTFYGVVGVLGGVASFPATNFGGFFVGLLLAIIGGSLAFAWTRLPSAPASEGPVHNGRAGGPGQLVVAIAVAAIAVTSGAGRAEASQSRPLQTGNRCPLSALCPSRSPSPSPSTSPSTPPSTSPGSPGVPVVPTPSVSKPGHLPLPPGKGSKSGNTKTHRSPHTTGTSGLEAYTDPVVLAAGQAHVSQFAYQGVTHLPTAAGGSVQVMKFTAGSFSASSVKGTIKRDGHATTLTSPSLIFNGDITLYATKLSGRLLGVPVTLTPHNAESLLLHQLTSVTPHAPVTMTDVTAHQPIMIANSLAGRLTMSTG